MSVRLVAPSVYFAVPLHVVHPAAVISRKQDKSMWNFLFRRQTRSKQVCYWKLCRSGCAAYTQPTSPYECKVNTNKNVTNLFLRHSLSFLIHTDYTGSVVYFLIIISVFFSPYAAYIWCRSVYVHQSNLISKHPYMVPPYMSPKITLHLLFSSPVLNRSIVIPPVGFFFVFFSYCLTSALVSLLYVSFFCLLYLCLFLWPFQCKILSPPDFQLCSEFLMGAGSKAREREGAIYWGKSSWTSEKRLEKRASAGRAKQHVHVCVSKT